MSRPSYEESSHHSLREAFTLLSEMRKKGEFCDITLTAGNIGVAAHKAVLSSRSLYFRGMFSSGSFKEAGKYSVNLPNISGDALLLVIDYIYNDKVRITKQNIKSLLHASDFLQLDDLTAMCGQFLKDRLNITNWLVIIR